MRDLLPLIGFSLVSSGSPGPNNLLLWASGIRFGYRATLPHVAGTAIGLGGMALAMAAGVGALVTAVPALQLVLRVAGSAYLLYLAYRIAGSRALRPSEAARPMRLGPAIAFQLVNPKSWIFALAAVTTFRPASLAVVPASLLVAATMMAVILVTASAWAAGGTVIATLVSGPRAHRVMGAAMALLLAASVATIWI
jgi:threonine/homoserine/homoserine lactone efflux protein